MNEIVNLCDGYKRLSYLEPLHDLLEPFYHMELSTPVLCATPWKMTHENKSSIAILLLHGYQGYPGEMSYLGLKLYQAGFDVYCPRLPGHGINQEDFLKTSSKDWLAVSRSSTGYLKKEYNKVYVAGHSMGGLIATIIPKEFQIEKLALIAPAFIIKGFNKNKIKFMKFFKKEISTPWSEDPSFWGICERTERDDRLLGANYWSKLVFSQLLELDKIREEALISLDKVSSKTICILGEKDNSIDSEKIEKLLRNKLKTPLEIKTIEGVNHLCQYFNDEVKRDLCNDSIVHLFSD